MKYWQPAELCFCELSQVLLYFDTRSKAVESSVWFACNITQGLNAHNRVSLLGTVLARPVTE